MPITDAQFQTYVDEQESAKEALSQTASELMQTTVNLRTQNAMLRKQVERLSAPPVESSPSTDSGNGDLKNMQKDAPARLKDRKGKES